MILLEMVFRTKTSSVWLMLTLISNQMMKNQDNDISPSDGDKKMISKVIEPSKGMKPRSQSHAFPVASLVRLIWIVKQGTIWAKLKSRYTADNNAETKERILICWAINEITRIAAANKIYTKIIWPIKAQNDCRVVRPLISSAFFHPAK